MKVNLKKSTIRSLFLVAGLSFFLSGCSLRRDNAVEQFRQELESYSDELYKKYKDMFDKIYDDNNNQESAYDNYEDDYDELEQEDSKTDAQEESEEKIIEINHVSELDKYFQGKVSFQDLRKAIRNNSNLSSKDKKISLNVVDKLEEKAPYINLRCLYENSKLLRMKRGANTDTNSKAVAQFDSGEHEISIYKDDDHYLIHELLHMITLLSLYMEDKNIYLYRSFNSEDTDFILEGFTEWFEKYLFDCDEYSYYEQVNDIDIIKYILELSDKKLIKELTDGNSSYITKSLKKYLTKDEVNKWISISEKEVEASQDKSKQDITSSELVKKYTILLKACIQSKEVIGSSEKYQIMELLFNVLWYYSTVRTDIDVYAIMDGIEDKLMENIDYTNNDIEILYNDQPMNYCDIEQLYLIQYANGNNYTIAEQYMDSNGKEKYYANIPYDLAEGDVIVPVTELIEYADLGYESYTGSDLVKIYQEYKGEGNKASGAYRKSQNGR